MIPKIVKCRDASDFGASEDLAFPESLIPAPPKDVATGAEINILDESNLETAAIEESLVVGDTPTVNDSAIYQVQAFETTFLQDPPLSDVVKGAVAIETHNQSVKKKKVKDLFLIAAVFYVIASMGDK